jgi:hypothetical protein
MYICIYIICLHIIYVYVIYISYIIYIGGEKGERKRTRAVVEGERGSGSKAEEREGRGGKK